MNIEALDINGNSFLLAQGVTEEGVFTSLGADTYPAGTILGRVTASSKWTPYNSAAGDGSEVPKAILLAAVTATGAAEDFALFVMTTGKVRKDLSLVWNGGAPIEVTAAEMDTLRSYSLIVQPVTELNNFDNPV